MYRSRKARKQSFIRRRQFIKSYANCTESVERKSVLSQLSSMLNKLNLPSTNLHIPSAVNRADSRTRQYVANHQEKA